MSEEYKKIMDMFLKEKGSIPYSFSFGQEGDQHCIVVGALHGNEDAGLRAIERLYKEKDSIKNKITVVLGNPEAYKKDVRYLDENLNRIFKDPIEGLSYEAGRAREIEMLFANIAKQEGGAVVIDIHTTSQGEEPLLLCHENDKKTLHILKNIALFDTIVLITEKIPHSLCSLSQKYKFSYIGAECGTHKTARAGSRAFALVKEIAAYLVEPQEEMMVGQHSHKKIIKIKEAIKPTAGLRFTVQKVRTVTPVKKGEVWAIDNEGEKVAKEDMALFCIPKKIRYTDTNAGFICSHDT